LAAAVWVCTLASGDAVRVDQASMVIGRSRSCDIVIDSPKASRHHASLTLVEGELWIEDLGSANGLWLQGEKVTRRRVVVGDVYAISDETLRFALDSGSRA
jgi:pSer/pThr/pTyr-binding forkhead associated (FHA) protein